MVSFLPFWLLYGTFPNVLSIFVNFVQYMYVRHDMCKKRKESVKIVLGQFIVRG